MFGFGKRSAEAPPSAVPEVATESASEAEVDTQHLSPEDEQVIANVQAVAGNEVVSQEPLENPSPELQAATKLAQNPHGMGRQYTGDEEVITPARHNVDMPMVETSVDAVDEDSPKEAGAEDEPMAA